MNAATPPIPTGKSCVFLDVDGTLVEFASTPCQVRIDPALISLLEAVQGKLGGAVSLVSGRSVENLDRLFDPLRLPSAGLHGLERRDALGRFHATGPGSDALASARDSLKAFARQHPGLLLEDKQSALAMHFRLAPETEARVKSVVADAMTSLGPEFEALEGSSVIEIKPSSHNKATAVDAFMREAPFDGRIPVYLGDDITDLHGFAAAERHGGMAIAVGDRVHAPWRLEGPAAVRDWLAALVAAPAGS